jgi:hypothetical protein
VFFITNLFFTTDFFTNPFHHLRNVKRATFHSLFMLENEFFVFLSFWKSRFVKAYWPQGPQWSSLDKSILSFICWLQCSGLHRPKGIWVSFGRSCAITLLKNLMYSEPFFLRLSSFFNARRARCVSTRPRAASFPRGISGW